MRLFMEKLKDSMAISDADQTIVSYEDVMPPCKFVVTYLHDALFFLGEYICMSLNMSQISSDFSV